MSIAKNIEGIEYKINKACRQWKLNPEHVNLIAVSKKQPIERIKEALEDGHRLFGENIVQDAIQTWEKSGLKDRYKGVRLHLIGALQTNKVKDAVSLFDVIETVDRPKLVDALVKEIKQQNKQIECFVQVNTGEEPQKSGVVPSQLASLLEYAEDQGLKISGLMCIPPVNEPSGLHFAFLKKLAQIHKIENLSMGMSDDFEKSVPLGATHIRVGTSIFGERTST
ncbi:MAG: YggS family pyridoxal phosphate-dependent enzyme [Bdellovibrionales bacterium]